MLLVKADLFKDFLWQGSGDEKMNVNDALEVFLVPISLLFALMFSVSFDSILGKQSEIRVHINKEVCQQGPECVTMLAALPDACLARIGKEQLLYICF